MNYLKYRAIRDEEDRREQNRLSQEAWRKRNQSKPASAAVIESKPIGEGEGEGEGKEKTKTARKRAAPAALVSVEDMIAEGVSKPHATDWLATRKGKGLAPLTSSIWAATKEEAAKANLSPGAAIARAAAEGWGGFKARWLTAPDRGHAPAEPGQFDGVQ